MTAARWEHMFRRHGMAFALAMAVAIGGILGCGGGGASSGGGTVAAKADAAVVTYYYLPG